MKQCSTCRQSLPMSAFWKNQQNCKNCARAYMRQYRQQNKDRIRVCTNDYRKRNPERARAWNRDFREKNPEYFKIYYQTHKELYREWGRRTWLKHRDRINARARTNQKRKEYEKNYQSKNRLRINEKLRRHARNLTDGAVKKILLNQFRRQGFALVRASHLSRSMIETAKTYIQAVRLLKETKHGRHQP